MNSWKLLTKHGVEYLAVEQVPGHPFDYLVPTAEVLSESGLREWRQHLEAKLWMDALKLADFDSAVRSLRRRLTSTTPKL